MDSRYYRIHGRLFQEKCGKKLNEMYEKGEPSCKFFTECLENEVIKPTMEEIKKDYDFKDDDCIKQAKLRELAHMRLDIEQETGRKYNDPQSIKRLMNNAQVCYKFHTVFFKYPEEIYEKGGCNFQAMDAKVTPEECHQAETEIRNMMRGLGSKK